MELKARPGEEIFSCLSTGVRVARLRPAFLRVRADWPPVPSTSSPLHMRDKPTHRRTKLSMDIKKIWQEPISINDAEVTK